MKHTPYRFGAQRMSRASQQGATLLVSMIFLVILTLTVVSALKVSTLNTQMVGNMQSERSGNAAAQQAIETTISADFTQNPQPSTAAVDLDNSGRTGAVYNVDVPAPLCTGIKPIKMSELDAANKQDQPCFASGAANNSGFEDSGTPGNSLCSSSNWDVSAATTSPIDGSKGAATHQGIAVRVAVGADCPVTAP